MSGASQRGSVLFKVFVGSVYSGIEYTLRKFAHGTKLNGVVDVLEEGDAIQRDLG